MPLKIEVLSHFLFDEKMNDLNLNDDNVENTNKAFISIIGTKKCLKYYLEEEDTKHFFNDNNNVLNLDFDDISRDLIYQGHLFKTMSIKQAERAIDFIKKMIEKGVDEIIIHCRAGYSRSRAFGEFIYRYCMENDIDVEYEDREQYTTMLNQDVLNKLTHAYNKKHGYREYSDGRDYPSDLTDTTPNVLN